MSKRSHSPEPVEDLPERIERLRHHLRINSSKLAQMLGVSRSYVTNLRKGHHCSLPVLTLIEKFEAESFGRSAAEPRYVETPFPPRPAILPTKTGIGLFQSFPAGQGPYGQGAAPSQLNGKSNGDTHESVASMGATHGNGEREGRWGPPLQVGEPAMPRKWQPAFLPLWRQYDVSTRSLGELVQQEGESGCLTTDVDDPKAFAMRVEGDEMAPLIFGGDFIVISPKEPIRTGGVALAQLREQDGGGVLLRQVSLTERGRVLGRGPGGILEGAAGIELEDCVWVAAVWSVVRRL